MLCCILFHCYRHSWQSQSATYDKIKYHRKSSMAVSQAKAGNNRSRARVSTTSESRFQRLASSNLNASNVHSGREKNSPLYFAVISLRAVRLSVLSGPCNCLRSRMIHLALNVTASLGKRTSRPLCMISATSFRPSCACGMFQRCASSNALAHW